MTLRTALLAAAGVLGMSVGARAAAPAFVVVGTPVAVVSEAPPLPIAVLDSPIPAAPMLAVAQMVAEQQAMMNAMMADMGGLRMVALPGGMMAPMPALMAGAAPMMPGQMVVTRVMIDGPERCQASVTYRAGANGQPVIEAASHSSGCAAVPGMGHLLAAHPARAHAPALPANGLSVDARGDRLYSLAEHVPVTPAKPKLF